MRETSSAKSATFTVSGPTDRRLSIYKRTSSGDSAAPCGSPCFSGTESPFRRLSGLWLCSLIGFREVKENHQAALWLGGLEAVTGGLRDYEDLVLAGA